jgi:hypothetical protein
MMAIYLNDREKAALKRKQPSEQPPAVTDPNRLKFASLVSKLDPHSPDFAERVACLEKDRRSREDLIDLLTVAVTEGEVEDKVFIALKENFDECNALDKALRAAIERFVVDRY